MAFHKKSTLKATIDALHNACPLKVSCEVISKAFCDILHNDKVFCEHSEIHTKIFDWLEEKNPSQPSRPYAVFKKWVYSSAFFGSKGQGAFIEPIFNLVEKALNEFLIENEHMIPSAVAKIFASKHHINPDFDNADTQCMLNFIIENIKIFDKSVFPWNRVAHGTLIDQKGQWSDHKLQYIAILACNVVTCDNYKELHAIKEKLDNKIIQKWMDDN
nr:11241_t:CDS:2 [Entrophospora candida]